MRRVVTCKYLHKPSGVLFHINVRRNSRRYVARWAVDHVSLSVPYGETVEQVEAAITDLLPRLLSRRPTTGYSLGQVIDVDGLHIEIVSSNTQHGYVRSHPNASGGYVEVDSDVNLSDPSATTLVTRMLLHTARYFTDIVIVARASEVCRLLGLEPGVIKHSLGMKVMGHCSAKGEIHLSAACAFLTADLRDYIICHELSHRVHFDHSAAFHALCSDYLRTLGYSDTSRQMQRKLNEYKSPLIK